VLIEINLTVNVILLVFLKIIFEERFGDNDEDDGSNGMKRIKFEKVYVNDVMDEAARLEIEEGRPSEWMIMKEVSTVQSHVGHFAVA
jgi:hypothetical protein